MQEFEVIGLEAGDARPSVDAGDTPAASHGAPRWWLILPVVVAVGILILLSRGSSGQAADEGAETTVPASTTVPNETEETDPTESSLAQEDLLASFAGQVVLTGASGREIRVNDLASGMSYPLDIKGVPLYFVDGWLVYVEEAKVQVLNLLDAGSEPLVILESEPSGSGVEVLVGASPTILTITRFSYEGNPSADVTGFAIGQWGEPIVTDSVSLWLYAGGLVSSPGNGTYELTQDGYIRRGDGFVIAANRDLAVVWECHQSLSSCQMRARDRASWNVVGSSIKATPNTDMVLAPQGAIVLQIDWRQETFELVNLMNGDRVDLDTSGLQNPYFEKLLAISESAVLATTDGVIVVIDRANGAITPLEVDGSPNARQGILVESMLPYLMEKGR